MLLPIVIKRGVMVIIVMVVVIARTSSDNAIPYMSGEQGRCTTCQESGNDIQYAEGTITPSNMLGEE